MKGWLEYMYLTRLRCCKAKVLQGYLKGAKVHDPAALTCYTRPA